MTWTVAAALAGGAQTGFTAPIYNNVVDIAPSLFGKQVAVTSLGGTQAGVSVHAGNNPFTITIVKPSSFKVLGKTNPVTGLLPSVPKNDWTIIVRKGMIPLAGQPPAVAIAKLVMSIPAGAEVANPAEIRAMLSALIGAINGSSAGLGDTLVTTVV